MQMQKYQG